MRVTFYSLLALALLAGVTSIILFGDKEVVAPPTVTTPPASEHVVQPDHYSSKGPLGDVFQAFPGDARLKRICVSGFNERFAQYAQPGQDWTFIDSDEEAETTIKGSTHFTSLRKAGAKFQVESSLDIRHYLEQGKAGKEFGALIIDLPLDAIPVHWLTREAQALFFQHLTPNGFLVYHISNPHVDLETVLASVAEDAKFVAYTRKTQLSKKHEEARIIAPQWLVVARKPADVAALLKCDDWRPARVQGPRRVIQDDGPHNFEEMIRWRGLKED